MVVDVRSLSSDSDAVREPIPLYDGHSSDPTPPTVFVRPLDADILETTPSLLFWHEDPTVGIENSSIFRPGRWCAIVTSVALGGVFAILRDRSRVPVGPVQRRMAREQRRWQCRAEQGCHPLLQSCYATR